MEDGRCVFEELDDGRTEMISLPYRPARKNKARIGRGRAYERSKIKQDDLIIPRALIINPYASLRIIPRLTSFDRLPPTLCGVPMDHDPRPRFIL